MHYDSKLLDRRLHAIIDGYYAEMVVARRETVERDGVFTRRKRHPVITIDAVFIAQSLSAGIGKSGEMDGDGIVFMTEVKPVSIGDSLAAYLKHSRLGKRSDALTTHIDT